MNTHSKPKSIQSVPLGIAVLGAVCLFFAANQFALDRQFFAVAIGLLAGFTLYHASFGFTAGWRKLLAEGRGSGLRYQLPLIFLVSSNFISTHFLRT